MGLKQSIVIRSEYTIRNSSAKGGTRGGTPGNFVMQYMSRDDATEIVNPKLADEFFNNRYQYRNECVENANSELDIKHSFYKGQKKGGVAFNEKNLSLSYKDLVLSSKQIQNAFNEGKTVLKTVISFDEEYLKEKDIIPKDFQLKYKGDYKGHIDQMKLRYAIHNGLDRASEHYSNLHYVGAIQVDTKHIHCHLAMVDLGKGNVTEDGTQKGKISSGIKDDIRQGIDAALDETKQIQFMSSSVSIDKKNKRLNHERYIYKNIALYSAPQQIRTLLPDDMCLWKSGSGKKEMEQADKLCRKYVENMYANNNSVFNESMLSIIQYAEMRQRMEKLEEEEKERIIANGKETLIKKGMNDVYKSLCETMLVEHDATPFQEYSAQKEITPSYKNDLKDFVYKVRTYKSRYHHHRMEAERFGEYVSDYEKERANGEVSNDSHVLYRYFLVEQEYQQKLAEKYDYFVNIRKPTSKYAQEYLELHKKSDRINNMVRLQEDTNIKCKTADEVEEYARVKYDIYGGRNAVLFPQEYQRQINEYRNQYEREYSVFQAKLDCSQLKLTLNADGTPHIQKEHKYKFKDVKGLDLHNIKADFDKKMEYSDKVRDDFIQMAQMRINAYDYACNYLDETGQDFLKKYFDKDDIELMRQTVKEIADKNRISYENQKEEPIKKCKTISLDKRTHEHIQNIVSQNLYYYISDWQKEQKEQDEYIY